MKLIVGLGNPDKKYNNTRHNIGFMVVDNYLKDATWSKKFNGLYTTVNIGSEKVIFLKPQTYMNLSGQAVIQFVQYFDIKNTDILVIQDDLDQNIGAFKLKTNSGSGGHNGIKSIISSLHTENFARLKIGINSVNKGEVIDFVLSKFSKTEMSIIEKNYITFNDIIEKTRIIIYHNISCGSQIT